MFNRMNASISTLSCDFFYFYFCDLLLSFLLFLNDSLRQEHKNGAKKRNNCVQERIIIHENVMLILDDVCVCICLFCSLPLTKENYQVYFHTNPGVVWNFVNNTLARCSEVQDGARFKDQYNPRFSK